MAAQLFSDYRIDTAAILALTLAIAVLTIVSRITLEDTAAAVERMASVAATSNQLAVQYVDDGADGASYRRTAEIVQAAKNSVVFVDYWEPFEKYQSHLSVGPSTNSRSDFYHVLDRSVFSGDSVLGIIYRRIVQLPPSLWESKRIPFSIDPLFAKHLHQALATSKSHPDLVQMRVAPVLWECQPGLAPRCSPTG